MLDMLLGMVGGFVLFWIPLEFLKLLGREDLWYLIILGVWALGMVWLSANLSYEVCGSMWSCLFVEGE